MSDHSKWLNALWLMGVCMSSISETIQRLVEAIREHGIEPNRVRMGAETYRKLYNELIAADGGGPLERGDAIPGTIGHIHGLTIVLAFDCSPDNIYVDHTDDPDIVAKQVTSRFGESNA